MRNRPIGSNEENPVPSFAVIGANSFSIASCTLLPHTIPAAPRPSIPRNTRRPTGDDRSIGASPTSRRYGTAVGTVPRVDPDARRIVQAGYDRVAESYLAARPGDGADMALLPDPMARGPPGGAG